jgi:hypothetical protein
LFEETFFSDTERYVGYTAAERSANGSLTKNVTLNSGEVVVFEIKTLSPSVDSIVKIDSSNINATVAARSISGKFIVAQELEHYAGPKVLFSTTAWTASDIPNVTPAEDLSTWTDWGRRY